MREAIENYFLQEYGRSSDGKLHLALDQAYLSILKALTAVERAEPQAVEVKSKAHLRRVLASSIKDAMERTGEPVNLSDGRALDKLPVGAAESDLTPFERLISALEIHVSDTPAALAKWVGRAVGQD